jgi:hypothetical protein
MEDISDRVLNSCDQLRPSSASFGGICIKKAPALMSVLGSGLQWHQLAPPHVRFRKLLLRIARSLGTFTSPRINLKNPVVDVRPTHLAVHKDAIQSVTSLVRVGVTRLTAFGVSDRIDQ